MLWFFGESGWCSSLKSEKKDLDDPGFKKKKKGGKKGGREVLNSVKPLMATYA
jgi:hypothetical protein